MHLSLLEWIVTVAVLTTVLGFDVLVIARRPREPSITECVVALSGYLLLAVGFGMWIWHDHGSRYGMQFFASWVTEYSLSVDNLFVFVLIIGSFNVPDRYRQQVLFLGILLALVFRGIFITLGGVAVQHLSWVFYLLGVFIIYTAYRMFRSGEPSGDGDNAVVRFARAHLNTTDTWDGLKLYVKHGSRRFMTPMFLVVVALASTDLMFAMDSIPAIYGLTREPYLVFAANVLALMGLRQLYFLLGGALKRLEYLFWGLAAILGFIGFKLILQGLRQNGLPFINGGEPVAAPKISTAVSLGIIAAILAVSTVFSLYKTRGADAN